MNIESRVHEVCRFADLDFDPMVSEEAGSYIVQFRQNGEDVKLVFSTENDKIIEERAGEKSAFSTYRGLLSSANFGNLRRFVEVQKAILIKDAPYIADFNSHLPVVGDVDSNVVVPNSKSDELFEKVDTWLALPKEYDGTVRTLVIDGPAGIGKTHLIRKIAYFRAINFGPGSAPPLLHIQSRGRKLTTLSDVIAGTLQTARINVTYDQLPVLIRHGLIQIAIDGFDELADPNGYETAWASVREFVEEILGGGVLVLAGRDTFIDAESVKRSLPLLATPSTGAVRLRTLLPDEARDWLRSQSWTEDRLKLLKERGLFEKGSYALRPFFVSEINKYGDMLDKFDEFLSSPLEALIETIVTRELTLISFAKPKDGFDLRWLLIQFYQEIARDMADSETDSIDEASLRLIVELVFTDKVRDEDVAPLRHRATSLALLEQDSIPGRRRFPHSEIQSFFLAKAYIDLIGGDSVYLPKSLRRNILGADFLENFCDVALHANLESLNRFIQGAQRTINKNEYSDRTTRNLAALLLAALPASNGDRERIRVEHVSMDEAIIRGEIPDCLLHDVQISQLDVRGADISKAEIKYSEVGILLADATTALPVDMPRPACLTVEMGSKTKSFFNPKEIQDWIRQRQPISGEKRMLVPNGELGELFYKMCRVILRQTWIRDDENDRAGRYIQSEYWPQLRKILEAHQVLEEREWLQAGCRRSNFYRIRRARDFLDPECMDSVIVSTRAEIGFH